MNTKNTKNTENITDTKTAIYNLEAGTLSASKNMTAQEQEKAKRDIAAVFDRIPADAQAIIWEGGKVTKLHRTPDGTPTKKYFFTSEGQLYQAGA